MKYLLSVLLLLSSISYSQSAKEIWKPLLDNAEIAKYFSGMWESLGITVKETGEELTVYHRGNHFEIKNDIKPEEVDYYIVLDGKSVKDMAKYGEDGRIDQRESYKIMGTLFTPFVRSSLKHPMMRKKFQMKIAGIEDFAHVYLEGPNNNDIATHTLIFHDKQWIVAEGIHGNAKRVFEITVDDAIKYQREAFKAKKENTRKSWKAFKKFYLKWRKDVSHKAKED